MKAPTSVFDREVLLDISVNIIPLAILLVFAVAFVFIDPWSHDNLFSRVLEYALLVLPFVGLAVLTYVAARRMEIVEADR